MANSSSDESTSDMLNWTFYRDRPGWSDVKITPQDDDNIAVVKIAYSDKFKDVFDYFRAIIRTNEISERAFILTTDAAELNPANYTVWHYRRILLRELKKDLKEELHFVGDMIKDHPKTYQLWHHRSVIVDWLQDASEELQFTQMALEQDAKNYHAWQHRQWTVRTFDLWDGELEFVSRLLDDDVRNNSAWNQRYFVISNTSKYTGDTLTNEVKFTMQCIEKASHNESAWNYLSGILFDSEVSSYPGLSNFLSDLYNAGNRSPYLLAFMVDFHENQIEQGSGDHRSIVEVILNLCDSLAKQHDTIRSGYWNYVARCIAKKYRTPDERVS